MAIIHLEPNDVKTEIDLKFVINKPEEEGGDNGEES